MFTVFKYSKGKYTKFTGSVGIPTVLSVHMDSKKNPRLSAALAREECR